MRILIFSIVFFLITPSTAKSQGCCSGGSGSPIAGDAATGVLDERQFDVSLSHQYFLSRKFFAGDSDTLAMFDRLSTNYLFLRADYGVSGKFTISLATGYFLDKTLLELGGEKEITASGIGDLIIFPRYNILNREKAGGRVELTLGLGAKIPLGPHNLTHVVFTDPISGKEFTTFSPPTIQPTNGALDLLFFGFLYRDLPLRKLRLFASGLYVRRGWNSLGEKFGDFATLSLYAGKSFTRRISMTAQIRGEWLGRIKAVEGVDLLASYNIEPESTGSKKLFFAPQFNYSLQSLTLYLVAEFPLYQYLDGIQVGSQYQFTTGLSYRWYGKKKH
jgi:hypothetical protein